MDWYNTLAEMNSTPHQPPPPTVPPSTGLSFASQSQPPGALFNFPSSSASQPPQPQPQPQSAPASATRSTRSSHAVHLSPTSAESPTALPAHPTKQQDEQHKAERRRFRRQAQAHKEQQAGYQDQAKQEGLMKNLLGMLGEFEVQQSWLGEPRGSAGLVAR